MATFEKQNFLYVPLTTPGYHSFWQEIASRIKSDNKHVLLLTTLNSLLYNSLNSFNKQSFAECEFLSDKSIPQDAIIQHQQQDQAMDISESSKHFQDHSPSRNSVDTDLNTIFARQDSSLSISERETENVTMIPNCNTSNSRKSGGSMRPKRCKEKDCNFVAYTDNEYWTHKANVHREIYPYVCPNSPCKFVTKYKHHMTHHQLSKHENVKPFGCNYENCAYRCVTKSMLVSHQKSHWVYYPYQCGTCMYKTKFLNIYKKHLRDNNHQHGIALNKNGIPDPSIIIDIYGTRRGPRRSTGTVTNRHGRNQSFNERSQAVNENNAYSTIIEAFQSFNLESSIRNLELLRSQMTNNMLEINDANSNPGELQRQSAIDVNCKNNISINVESFVQDIAHLASVIARRNVAITNTPLMLSQSQENEPTNTPLDLRVSETARRNGQS